LARKILLADDSVTAQNMGRKILADAGYEVVTVNNGSAALKKIAEIKPDIIILDVYMPGYSGLEVCQRLKDAQETSRIPVLLTVGKLEPFKPEEAKRVRAEGYIVKPFEASELLGTLSKLEDKIVPRAEPSKPGRFARANAALDEGRYDKSMATEEDSGWKNRIGFPSKKKKAAEDEGDESTIYNPVNKDLRTVVASKPGHGARDTNANSNNEDSRVDLGALAPEGLPKDVTPEEIAALAAAAAQVKGKLADDGVVAYSAADAVTAEIKGVEAKAKETQTSKETTQPSAELAKESPTESAATFAGQKLEEPAAAPTEKPFEVVKEAPGTSVPTPADMMAAIAGLVPEVGTSIDSNSGNGFGSPAEASSKTSLNQAADRLADEPVTMAMAAAAVGGFAATLSRWTAVPAALAPDEIAISLEHEMQKAHAAFAAAEAAHTNFVAPPEISAAAAASPVESAPPAVIAPEFAAPVSAAPMAEIAPHEAPKDTAPSEPAPSGAAQSEVTHSMNAVTSAATESIASAVKAFETVAARYVEPVTPVPPPPFEPVPAAPIVDAASDVKPAEVKPVEEAAAPQPETSKLETADAEARSEQPSEEQKEARHEERRHEERRKEEPAIGEQKQEGPVAAASPVEESSAITAPAIANEVSGGQSALESAIQLSESQTSASPASEDQTLANPVSASPVSAEASAPAVPSEPAAGGTKDMARKESEIAETTAAAWASWRRIRETGDSKATPAGSSKPKQQDEEDEDETPAPPDTAAMAVAAGAEKTPEEPAAAPEESPEIASIVDSVLADMRPRIVEEISRKMGKKK